MDTVLTADGHSLTLDMVVYKVQYDGHGYHEPDIDSTDLSKYSNSLVLRDNAVWVTPRDKEDKWRLLFKSGEVYAEYKNAQKRVVQDLEEHIEEVFERIAEIQKEIGET